MERIEIEIKANNLRPTELKPLLLEEITKEKNIMTIMKVGGHDIDGWKGDIVLLNKKEYDELVEYKGIIIKAQELRKL